MTNNWLSNVPSAWKITKLGSHFKCRNVKVDDTSYPPLSVTKQGILPQMDSVAKSDANDNRKQVLAGDFVINSRSDRKESCGLSELTGSVSLINTVLYQTDADYDKNYVGYLLKNYGFAEEFYRWGHGIVADLWTTRWQEMKEISLPLPPLDEQKRIVASLQRALTKIDELLENENMQLLRLTAYRDSLITEHLHDADGKNVRLKNVAIINASPNLPHNPTTKISYAPMETVRFDDFSPKEIEVGKLTSGLSAFSEGDVLLAKITPCFENHNVAIAQNLLNGVGVGSSELVSFTPKGINPRYLMYVLSSADFVENGKATIRGIGGLRRITPDFLNGYFFKMPTLEKQAEIVKTLDDKLATINKLVELKFKKVELLNMYKKSVTYEYVTGQKRR